MSFSVLAAVGIAIIGVVLLVGWHLLSNLETPPGPGEKDDRP